MATKLKKRISKRTKAIKTPLQIQAQVQADETLSRKVKSFRRLAVILTALFVILSATFKLAVTVSTFNQLHQAPGGKDVFILISTILLPAFSLTLFTFTGLRNLDSYPLKSAYRRLRIIVIQFAVLTSVMSVLLLYWSGAISYVGELIYTNAPAIGSNVSSLISNLLGWILSGIVGNFVYDLLKRKYLMKKDTQ